MPNGDPEFSDKVLPTLEAFFSPLAPVLEAFASKHNMKIVRYYHQSPTWSLQFRHPEGGIAKIDVERCANREVKIWACWWHDDYDRATRSIKRRDGRRTKVPCLDLEAALETTLTTVVSWEFGSWDSVHEGYEKTWHGTWTRNQFAAMDLDYPELKS